MEIRFMQAKDVAAVAALEQICFSDPWSENSIASELENKLSCWLVAVIDGNLAGYIGSQTVLDASDMMNIAVAPQYRRQGIAEALILALCEKLIERKAICLLLEVRASNLPAISLYEKLAFKSVGLRKNYYRNPKEDALILRKELL